MTIFIEQIYLSAIIYSLLIFLSFLLLKNYVAKIIIKFVKKTTEKYKLKAIGLVIDSVEKPLRAFLVYTGIYFALSVLPFNHAISLFFYRVFRTCIIISITQSLLNAVSAYLIIINNTIIKTGEKTPIIKTIFPLLSKFIKVFIIIFAVVLVAAEFDFKQLNSILAGVGIGGVAMALAAQDLIKNFFGGFVVLTDQSFNVGDFINIDSIDGVVEELGMRSTKIRTLDQELVVLPNSKFIDKPVLNYTKRDLRRASFTVGATYDTSKEKLTIIIEKIKEMLHKDPMVIKDSPLVKFNKFGPSSLDIIIQFMIDTGQYGEYMDIMDKINFKIMDIFEQEGVSFAFPSMSIYMEKNQ